MRLAACILGFLVGGLNLVQGSLQIPQCSAWGWLEIEDDYQALYISCEGFDADQTVVWQLVRDNAVRASSTCGPLPTLTHNKCNTTTSDITVLRLNNGHSHLYISDNHRELAGNGHAKCFLQNDSSTTTSCRTNVITPTVLTRCEVTMTTGGTLAGTCHFHSAYSSNGTYTCTWILTPLDGQNGQDVIIQGHVSKTWWVRAGGKLYYNGTCSFTSQVPAGHYNYTVRFLPGTPDSQYQGTVTDTALTTTSVLPTTAAISTSAPLPSVSTEHAVSTERTTADQSSPIEAYIAGGVVAVVVPIGAGVVVVVLVRRYQGRRLYDRPRRRRQLRRQPEENPYDVYEAVGLPAPVTPPTPDTAQSVYEIPDQDQETVPGVKISQSNTAFTSDIGDGYSTCVESQPYENDSRTDSSHPYENGSTPGSSHPYKNDYQSGTSSQPYENEYQAYDTNHPYNFYKNENPPDSSQPYENASLSDPRKHAE